MSKLKYLSLILFLVLVNGLFGQIPDRYRSEVFPNVVVTNNVKFSTGIPVPQHASMGLWELFINGALINVKEYNTTLVDIYMDVYEPDGDIEETRPLIILCFGGGFVKGERDFWSIVLLAEGLAKMGYVVASIDYRLGMNLFDKDLSARAVYRGVQDSRSAIRFFKADAAGANNYKIDTENIFIGGHSSGGFIALHNLYMDDELAGERPCSTYDWIQDGQNIPDLGCLDCVGDNLGYSGQADGVFNLAGALGYLNLIDLPTDAPPIMFHSQDDGTVPYDTGLPFQDQAGLDLLNPDLPTVFGSYRISLRADTVGLNYDFHSYTSRGHGVHEEIDPTKLYDDILPSIGDWFYINYLKPDPGTFVGSELICDNDLIQSYSYNQNQIQYYDWIINGESFQSTSPTNNTIEVTWDPGVSEHKITLIPYSENGAAGDMQEYVIEISSGGNNIWMGSDTGDWEEIANWSKGHPPLSCEIMVIPAEANPKTIQVPADTNIECNGLQVGQNVTLNIPGSSSILTNND